MSKHLTTIREEFEQAVKPSLEKLSTANASFVGEKTVAYVLETGRWLFKEPIDKVSEDELFRVGGHLTVAYGYFGNLCANARACLLYTSPSPRDRTRSRMPSSA